MKSVLSLVLTACALLWWSQPAQALDFCSKEKACKATYECHASVCVPAKMICTKTGTQCASYEKCDFTCPHGAEVPVSVSTSDQTDPPKSDGGGEEGGDKAEPPPKKGEDSKGSTPGNGPTASTCPKDKGVCIVDFDKLPVAAKCKGFCAVVGKCSGSGAVGGGGSGSSTGSAGSTPSTPVPAPDPDGGGEDSGDDDGKEDKDSKKGDGKEAPQGEKPKSQDFSASIKACERMCSLLQVKKIALAEFDKVNQCVTKNASKDCDAVGKDCEKDGQAWADKIEDNEDVLLYYGGGWGSFDDSADIGVGTSSGGNSDGNKAGGSAGGQEGPTAANLGGGGNGSVTVPAGASSGGGCSASPNPSNSNTTALWLLMLAAFGWLLRKRLTTTR